MEEDALWRDGSLDLSVSKFYHCVIMDIWATAESSKNYDF